MTEIPWYDDDRFWEKIGAALFSDSHIGMATEEVDAIVSLTGIGPRASVLDLGCGVGRHAVEFARRGFDATGVDRTTGYIEQARRRAAGEGLPVEFVRSDMRLFAREGAFDLIVCLYTTFGYFQDRADDRRVIENVYRSLRRGGVFVIDVMGRETLKRLFNARSWHEEGDVVVLEDGKVSERWDRVDNRWIIMRGDKRTELEFSLHVYSADELKDLLQGCGLEVTGTYGWFDGVPYDEKAKRLVIVSRKP